MRKFSSLDLCLASCAVALHVLLEAFCTIRIGNDLKITFAALPFIVIAFLKGPLCGVFTAASGSFLSQLLTFGVTPTTALWVLPYALCALFAGLCFKSFRKKRELMRVLLSVAAANFALTASNIFASYIDGVVVYKYMTAEALALLIPFRLLTCFAVCAVYTAAAYPLLRALKKTAAIH